MHRRPGLRGAPPPFRNSHDDPRLSLSGIDKSYGSLQVLHGVSLTVQPGGVHRLLGENGAVKSTLLNFLSGVIRSDGGVVEIDGKPASIGSSRDSTAAGIAMIHQELQEVPELSLAQNILLGGALRRLDGLLVDREVSTAHHHGSATSREVLQVQGLTRGKAVGTQASPCTRAKCWALPGWSVPVAASFGA